MTNSPAVYQPLLRGVESGAGGQSAHVIRVRHYRICCGIARGGGGGVGVNGKQTVEE